ncbi:MAG: ATP-binding protein [Desulfobulbus sp.]
MSIESQSANTSNSESHENETLFLNSENEWKRIVDVLPDLIFVINLRHEIVYMNKTMLTMIGSNHSDVIGTICFNCVHGKDCLLENCLHEKMLKDHKPHMLELYDERLGGNVEMLVAPYFNRSGNIIGSVHIVRNVTDRIENQKEKEKLHVQLLRAQKLESVGQLASGIAHEINSPVQFITSNISFIEESFNDIKKYIDFTINFIKNIKNIDNNNKNIVELIRKTEDFDWEFFKDEVPVAVDQSKEGLQRVTSIVQAMKNFSHPGGEGKVEADINRIIMTTITISRNEWKYVSIVETKLNDDIKPVWCNVNAISQVILNILINAAHAIESKIGRNPVGKKGNIEVSTKQKEEHVEIRISDTGIGIPEEIKNRVFDPFFTTKEVGKGTGQGLAIAHDIICVKHQGKIIIESEQDLGTTFIIELPNTSKE